MTQKAIHIKVLVILNFPSEQEPCLFDLSVAENIRFGFSEATQDEVEKAARQANAHDFIVAFPDGYDTQVWHLNIMLSFRMHLYWYLIHL